jgi:hypothetical protein
MPNWKKVIVSGSNAVLNHITASGHMSVLDGGLTVNTHTSTELEVVGDISASSGTITGNDIVATNQLEAKYRKLDITTTTIGDYNGDVVFFGEEGDDFDQHHIHYYTGVNWERASESNIASAKGLLAIAIGTEPSQGMLIRGFFTIDTDLGASGEVLYLTTNGNYSITPTDQSGRYSRVVGHLINGSNPNRIYFNPSPDWIEIE